MKRRCQWSKGCARPRHGLGRLCLAHRREQESRKLSSPHDDEILLPERKSWEYEPKDYWED